MLREVKGVQGGGRGGHVLGFPPKLRKGREELPSHCLCSREPAPSWPIVSNGEDKGSGGEGRGLGEEVPARWPSSPGQRHREGKEVSHSGKRASTLGWVTLPCLLWLRASRVEEKG